MDQPDLTPKPQGSGCSSGALKGCAITVVLLSIVMAWLLFSVMRNPTLNSLVTCRKHMVEVGRAIQRYRDTHGDYPSDLASLPKGSLPNPENLICPLEKSGSASYTYHKPPAGAGGDFVVLECDRHTLGSHKSPTVLLLSLNGALTTRQPQN